MALVILKKGEGRTLKAGGSWVFDNEIDKVEGDFEDGDIVTIHDFDGYPMGKGFINRNSKIRVRVLTRSTDTVIDKKFYRMRLENAWEYRKKTIDTSSCRVVFAEADFLPGLIVDKFSDCLVMCFLTLGINKVKDDIVEIMKDIFEKDGIHIKGIYERSDAKVRLKEGLPIYKGFIGAEFDTNVAIVENGVKYIVDVKDGQKTGFFLDQKNNRKSIWSMAKGAKVLDCFTHTGSFALNAGLAGAKEVLALDASELAIAQAEENAKLNGLSQTVKFECADVFEKLPELENMNEKYDLVILDPPAFTKSKASVKNAIKGYKQINLRGLKLVKDGGYLATCSCSHFMTQELFADTIGKAAHDAHKRLRQVSFATQAPDHPILWAADESYYLKFLIFQVVDEK